MGGGGVFILMGGGTGAGGAPAGGFMLLRLFCFRRFFLRFAENTPSTVFLTLFAVLRTPCPIRPTPFPTPRITLRTRRPPRWLPPVLLPPRLNNFPTRRLVFFANLDTFFLVEFKARLAIRIIRTILFTSAKNNHPVPCQMPTSFPPALHPS